MRITRWLRVLFAKTVETTSSLSEKPTTPRADTEFTAEIVRLTAIIPHPNADRLEIARFELAGLGECAYEVVIQKGTAKAGDLMAYFSVDCVLPLAHPAFAFLGTRLDGAGKTHYRLRAARLRGVFSQGLLVPRGVADSFEFGQQVAAAYGVTYHQTPVKGESELGSANAKKVSSQPIPIYSVDSLKKMPRLFSEGEPVMITEKIHGTNFRFGWIRRKVFGIKIGWKFVCGSHRTMRGETKGSYYDEDIWTKAARQMDLAERTKAYKGCVFYGELYGYTYGGGKIQDLDYGCLPTKGPALAIFDVQDKGHWVDAWTRLDICSETNLPHVPVLSAHTYWHPSVLTLADGKSTLDKQTVREGCVVESLTGSRRKAKYVSEGYLLRKGA